MKRATQLFAVYGKKRVPVASVEDAANRWNDFRDRSGGGASEIGNGVVVVDARGVAVAEISYNGRIWKPGGKELLVADDHPAQPGKPFRVEDTWRPQVKAKSATCPKCGKTGSASKLKRHIATCGEGSGRVARASGRSKRPFLIDAPKISGCSRKNCDLPAGHPGHHATDYAARTAAAGSQLTLDMSPMPRGGATPRVGASGYHYDTPEARRNCPFWNEPHDYRRCGRDENGRRKCPDCGAAGEIRGHRTCSPSRANVAGTTEKWTPEPGPNGGMWAHTAGEYVLAVWPSNNPSDRAAGFWWWAVSRHGHPVADGRKVGMEAAMLRAEEYVRLTTAEPEKPAVCGAKLHNERDARRYNWTQTCVLPSGHPGAHQPGQLTAAQFEHARHTAMTYADGVFEIRDAGPLSRFRKTGHWRVPGTNPPIVMAMTGDADGSYTVVGLDGKKYFGSSKEDAVDFALRGQKMEKPK